MWRGENVSNVWERKRKFGGGFICIGGGNCWGCFDLPDFRLSLTIHSVVFMEAALIQEKPSIAEQPVRKRLL